ncbi:MAG: hypothetical protein HZC55_23740 [Verrucomicrobia bacterium]|nr:hypothetical protein [Verrucomicrobiota bacterium]
MPQSLIKVWMHKFRPNGSGYCLVELTAENPNNDDVSVPTGYKVKMKGKAGPHEVKFTIQTDPACPGDAAVRSEKYAMVGIYFVHDQLPATERNIGQDQFPRFECNIADDPPSLTVHIDRDSAKGGDEYEFMILVQRLSDGALGIIDPEWENE